MDEKRRCTIVQVRHGLGHLACPAILHVVRHDMFLHVVIHRTHGHVLHHDICGILETTKSEELDNRRVM